MYWLDVTILVLLGLGAGLGFWSGLLWQVSRVVSLALALYATILFNEPTTQLVDDVIKGVDPRVSQGVAYVGVFLAVYLSMILLTRLLHRTLKAIHLDLLDRILGAVLGAAKVALIVAIACTALAALTLPITRDWMERSTLAPLFARGTEAGLDLVPEPYRARATQALQQFKDAVQSPTLPRLPAASGEEPAEPERS